MGGCCVEKKLSATPPRDNSTTLRRTFSDSSTRQFVLSVSIAASTSLRRRGGDGDAHLDFLAATRRSTHRRRRGCTTTYSAWLTV